MGIQNLIFYFPQMTVLTTSVQFRCFWTDLNNFFFFDLEFWLGFQIRYCTFPKWLSGPQKSLEIHIMSSPDKVTGKECNIYLLSVLNTLITKYIKYHRPLSIIRNLLLYFICIKFLYWCLVYIYVVFSYFIGHCNGNMKILFWITNHSVGWTTKTTQITNL